MKLTLKAMLHLLKENGIGRIYCLDCFSKHMTKQMALYSHVNEITHCTNLLDTFWATFCNHLFGHSDNYITKNKPHQPGTAIVHITFLKPTKILKKLFLCLRYLYPNKKIKV